MKKMYTIYCIYAFAIFCLLIITRLCFLIFLKCNNKLVKQIRTSPAKTMIILGSGGHTAEMLRIIKHLNLKNYSPRIYIHAHTDKMSADKVKEIEGNNTDYKIMEIYRSREVQQSYLTSIYTTIRATLFSVPLLWVECPELVLCNGPGTCVPLCITAFFFKVCFITQAKIVFIESFCRVKTLSLTGKILYYFADYVIVQWPYLSKPMYKRANMFAGASIERLIPWESLLNDFQSYVPISTRMHLSPIVKRLRDCCEKKLGHSKEWIENSLTLTEACIDKTWEALNSGSWKDVPIEFRYCYSFCTVLKAILLELQYESNTVNSAETTFEKIIQQIDKGILLGAPLPNSPSLLTTIASHVNRHCPTERSETPNSNEICINPENLSHAIPSEFSRVSNYEEPSMETFHRDIFMLKVPAILKGCISHWKALENWKNLDYLNKVAGSRTVPIEIGSRYTEEDWTQQLVKFSKFLQEHISTGNDKIGYLAQHPLFEQIPELKEDFAVPEYCSFSENEEQEQPEINAWFGPAGTVSPLHFDPKNNLLCQVFGHKKIILYHPNETTHLYPYDTRLLNNTAQVEPTNPDYEKWPEFRKAKGFMCYLKPGEMLYIPPKWWHHVTALTPSFSVSFWWN